MSFIKTYGRCYQKFDIKTDPTYIAPIAKENLKYTGEALELLNAGSTNDGTIKYSLDGINWSTSVPTGTEALTYTCYWKLEGDVNHNDVEQASISIEITQSHDYVDLGLPSGTKWATMNVGASSETDYGNYYQYGKGAAQYAATSGDSNYSGTENPLDSSVDTASQVWGGSWHMPTRAQMQELVDNTTYQWVTDYQDSGINGGLFTAQNGKSVFFPAAGLWYNGSQYSVGGNGYCWGSSPNGSNSAYFLYFSNGGKGVGDNGREFGYSVRAVQSAS